MIITLPFGVLVEEVRYPFENFLEFIPYVRNSSSILISFGYIALGRILYLALSRRVCNSVKLAVACLATSPFNNPAYTLLSLSPSDILGGLLILNLLRAWLLSPRSEKLIFNQKSIFEKIFPFSLLLLGSICGFIITNLGGIVQANKFDEIQFLSSNGRLLVGLVSGAFIMRSFRSYDYKIIQEVLAEVIGFILITQFLGFFLFFALHIVPYGTFQGGGFLDFPAFGLFSIERGHLGRIIAFFPPLLACLASRDLLLNNSIFHSSQQPSPLWRKDFLLSILAILLTFSTSSYAFTACFFFLYFTSKSFYSLYNWKFSRKFFFALTLTFLALILIFQFVYPVLFKAFDMVFGGEGEVRSINGLFDSFSFIGSGFYGSGGRILTGLDSYDLGFSVSSYYFGIFYLFFLGFVLFRMFRALNTKLQPLVSSPIVFASYGVYFLFILTEVSIGQVSASSLWFVLP